MVFQWYLQNNSKRNKEKNYNVYWFFREQSIFLTSLWIVSQITLKYNFRFSYNILSIVLTEIFRNQLDNFYHVSTLFYQRKSYPAPSARCKGPCSVTKQRENGKYSKNNPIYFEIWFECFCQNHQKNIVTKLNMEFRYLTKLKMAFQYWHFILNSVTIFFCWQKHSNQILKQIGIFLPHFYIVLAKELCSLHPVHC